MFNLQLFFSFSIFTLEASTFFELLNVQLAKLMGNKVVATCGGKEKAVLLKELGVDRVIDYKVENIKTVRAHDF